MQLGNPSSKSAGVHLAPLQLLWQPLPELQHGNSPVPNSGGLGRLASTGQTRQVVGLKSRIAFLGKKVSSCGKGFIINRPRTNTNPTGLALL